MKNIAIFFGGCSSEYDVSLASASSVLRHIDRTKFNPVLIGITRSGCWYRFTGDISHIETDTWEGSDCTPAHISPNRACQELLVFQNDKIEHVPLDAALPILHGRNGEDGTLQGLLELAGIPVAGCGVLSSALCMDKDRAHKLASLAGIQVPNALVLSSGFDWDVVSEKAEELGYPLFVKPVKAGSSFGVTKVASPKDLRPAIEEAFRYDNRVIIEEAIWGFEVGCAVMGNTELVTGEIDEIELADGFFDYTEKYNLVTSKIHVPARIHENKALELKETAKMIYQAFDCRVFARVDMFLTPEGQIVFNEVNTIPGFTSHSRFPSMMKAAGMGFGDVITKIIELAMDL